MPYTKLPLAVSGSAASIEPVKGLRVSSADVSVNVPASSAVTVGASLTGVTTGVSEAVATFAASSDTFRSITSKVPPALITAMPASVSST